MSVANLNDEVAEINVDDIKAQLQTINADLTELKNKSSAQADSITALQTTVTTQGTEISTVKRQVETQATAVTNLSNSLSTTNNNVTTNTNNIATNTANIASLSQNLTGVSTDVSRLNDELTETQTTLAGKQKTLTFDSTPTTGSNNPVTSDGIRKAIDEAGETSTVEWVETNLDQFIASLPTNVTYTTDITLDDINSGQDGLIPDYIFKGTFTKTGMFISSDRRYLKVVLNVTDVTLGDSVGAQASHVDDIVNVQCPFTYAAYYVTIRQDNGDFILTSSIYSLRRDSNQVVSSMKVDRYATFQANGVTTCNVYFKLMPELPIELT